MQYLFLKEGKEIWSGAILQDLVTVGRDDYIANTDAQHIARLPVFISNAINCLDYRQFNYTRLMRCNSHFPAGFISSLFTDSNRPIFLMIIILCMRI